MDAETLETLEAMDTYGGSFVKSLAKCCRHADPRNLSTLKTAFEGYFAQYGEMAYQDRENNK